MESIGNLTNIDLHDHIHYAEPDPLAAMMPLIYMSISGAITTLVYVIMNWAQERVMRMFTSTIQLKNNDGLYNLVLKFLVEGNYLEN